MAVASLSSDLFWLEDEFLPDSLALFERLAAGVVWDTRIRARKVASFGVPYNYSGMVWPEAPLPADILAVRDRVAARVGFVPNNCLANFYPDGAASMGFHRDATDELAAGTGIAVVSLGADREIAFRPEADRTRIVRRMLKSGSLLYMSPEMQADWKHGIEPIAGPVGGRISLTFRLLTGAR